MHVSAPGSSANLGPGFDCLGLALDIPFELTDEEQPETGARPFHLAESGHPARRAFVAAGGAGEQPLWWRSPIPPGRGLGYSGAARVAGCHLALGASVASIDETFRIACELEGHPDNAAASAFGGLVVASNQTAIRVVESAGLFDELRIVAWSPPTTTSTDASRLDLPESVPLDVAIASIRGAATWVAAVSSGRVDSLRSASRDELHQPTRLVQRPDSAAVLDGFFGDSGVLAAWLSGSGPTVAALVSGSGTADAVADRFSGSTPSKEQVRVLEIDPLGVRRIDS